jgi:hypothetical protein
VLDDLNGFQAIASGVEIPWNTPFKAAREALERREVRQIEEQGLRTIRFEETAPGKVHDEMIDLQNELYFNPDYGYGLRSASIRIEGIGGRSHLKQEGSYRALVAAYYRLYSKLCERYGEPSLKQGVKPDDTEPLIKMLDHSRETALVMALWSGARTQVQHELQVSYAPRHVLHFSAVAVRLGIRNETGRKGLGLDVVFPGGHSEAAVPTGGEKVFELPLEGEVQVEAKLSGKNTRIQLPIRGPRMELAVKRKWLGGALVFEPRS